ncbi:MAG: hypothetical protein AAF127_00515 [Pseudomonadota bacterium]
MRAGRLTTNALAVAALGLAGATGGAIVGVSAIAQDAPESLLPPGFDDPEPEPAPTTAPAPVPTAAPVGPAPVVAPAVPGTAPAVPSGPVPGSAPLPPVPQISGSDLASLPSIEELEDLSTDQLDDMLGLKPKYDIPPAARRSLSQVGVLGPQEGGMATAALAQQPASLVRAILSGTDTPLVSRWGHIIMRRALTSRLAAPASMDPVEFAALRVGVLNRMGEFAAARALAQDVDTGNWNESLRDEALTAYIATSDPVGACPLVRLQGVDRDNPQWVMMGAICNAYAGETALAGSQLNAALDEEIAPDIDILLARRFAGAAGRGRRAVSIEWDGVEELNPWRFALANAVGEPLPPALLEGVGPYFARAGALAPMLPLDQRALYASRAAEEGVLSARAMVDLYSAIFADSSVGGPAGERAQLLRNAYVARDVSERIRAMERLWNAAEGLEANPEAGHAAHVLTAYAAARVPPDASQSDKAGALITSMLTAGLDRDAAAWARIVEEGSDGWALIALASPQGGTASLVGLDTFADNDSSEEQRRSAFLVAGLAGLGRIGNDERRAFEDQLALDLDRETKWTRMIDRAAQVRNPVMVALLAGLGMQGNTWSQMTPLHLYHITRALNSVGLAAEARMIAAEAVARG